MAFYLITYMKHAGYKHTKESELVEGPEDTEENIHDSINGEMLVRKIVEMNKTKLLSTTDYSYYNLTKLCKKNNLSISSTKEIVKEEKQDGNT